MLSNSESATLKPPQYLFSCNSIKKSKYYGCYIGYAILSFEMLISFNFFYFGHFWVPSGPQCMVVIESKKGLTDVI